ncbi:MAG: FtsW/RodA/SpoVE family cell cycle protein, partial [Candidatus Eremiobacteraeota bacterium]|nr:FtsW/RodA/SpoVE family cell cycle protein [Candidatus Eremiobacteraeota bacterium]
MVFSASSATAYALHHDIFYFLKRQALWLAVALVCALIAYKLDYHKLLKLAPVILVLALLLLLAVLVPHVGIISGGARRWLGAGGLSFQPSEFAKLALVIYLAAAISRHHDRIRSFTKGLWPLLIVTLTIAVLILSEPDMGTASLVLFTSFAVIFIAGA